MWDKATESAQCCVKYSYWATVTETAFIWLLCSILLLYCIVVVLYCCCNIVLLLYYCIVAVLYIHPCCIVNFTLFINVISTYIMCKI